MENISEYNNQENILRLLNNSLDNEARENLLKQLQEDTSLQEEAAFSKSLLLALHNPEMIKAHHVLASVIREEGPVVRPAGNLLNRTWIWVGLLVIGLLSGSYFWLSYANSLEAKSQSIFKSALQPMDNVLYLPSEGRGLASLKAGMNAYDAGRFSEAAFALNTYVKQQPDEYAARLYLGISLLMAGNIKDAESALAVAAQSDEPPIREAAVWYLALTYLAKDEPKRANELLTELEKGSFYTDKAKALLQKIR